MSRAELCPQRGVSNATGRIAMLASSLLKRAAMAAVTLFGVAVVVFVLLRVVPGDPDRDDDRARRQRRRTSPACAPSTASTSRSSTQFVIWLGGILHGDFGISITLHRERPRAAVASGCRRRSSSPIVACALAVLLGGARRGHRHLAGAAAARRVIDAVNGFAARRARFLWALAFILVLGVLLPVLPLSGRIDPSVDSALRHRLLSGREPSSRLRFGVAARLLAHMVMPALALALPLAAVIARILKEALERGDAPGLRPDRAREGLVASCASCSARRCATRSARR